MDAKLAPHVGVVSLQRDPWDGVWRAAHAVTFEVRELPPPARSWDLVFNDDGFGIAVDDECETVHLADLFRDGLYEVSGRYIRDPVSTMNDSGHGYLDEEQLRFEPVGLVFDIGQDEKQVTLAGACFRFPRAPCQRCFWSLASLYHLLLLGDTYKGQASRWYGARWTSWEKYLQSQMLGRSLMKSIRSRPGQASAKDVCDTASIGTYGLVLLLMCLSFSGMGLVLGQTKHRGVCRGAFAALVCMLMGAEWQLHLFLTKDQEWNFPNKPHSDKYLALTVDACGMVVLAPWHMTSRPESKADYPLPFAEKAKIRATIERMPLLEFLECLCAEPFCHPIARQIGWCLGDRFESLFMFALFSGRPLRAPASIVMDRLPVDGGQRSIDRYLVAYWHAGRAAAAQHGAAQMCSVAVDKSAVGGKRVSNGMVSLSNNIAWWMVPQVAIGDVGGGPAKLADGSFWDFQALLGPPIHKTLVGAFFPVFFA